MIGLRTRLAAPARIFLVASIGASLVALWLTGADTPWLQLAFIAVAAHAFLRSDGRSTILLTTITTLAAGAIVLHLHANGQLPADDTAQLPLLAILASLFAAFANWRGRVERNVLRDRERLATLIDALPLATIAFDVNARVVTWNRTARELFGWTADEAFGKDNMVVPPGEQLSSDELHQRVLSGETLKGVEVQRRTATGEILELSIFSAPIDAEAGPRDGFIVMYDDIRERKRAERERDDAENRYRDLVEALPLVTYIDQVDDHATNVYTSPQVVALLGWSHEDWVANPGFFEEVLHRDDRERVMAQVAHANTTKDPFESEYRLRHSNGHYVWVRDHSAVLEGAGGEVLARGFLLDITEQKRLEEQLLQAQKMDAIGQFAGGIAHDFNNMLTAISGYAELASGSARADPALMRCLDGIKAAAGEAASLTSDLLSFSRRNVVERLLIDLNDVVRAAADVFEPLIPGGIAVRLDLGETLPPVSADPTQLRQVVLNLALNARDAMANGGILAITTAVAGDAVVLRVSDTGSGMSDETKSRAFEPFFTTKAEGEGTGLGLAVAYGVVDSLDGSLSIVSAPGEGTTVEAVLPAARVEASPTLVGASPHSWGPATARVLVVEDREVVRDLARDILAASGFDVVAASGGAEALAIALSTARFDLLLTDVVMPQMSGPELAVALRNRFADLPVLYMSGYTDDVLDASALAEPATAFLRKPFSNVELVEKVRELLDATHHFAAAASGRPTLKQ
jgi:two-component system cell cycle sensor histidine kinase/response regulator CckA